MSAAISELQTNEKPTTGEGIVAAVGERYGDDAKLNELVATLGSRSELLRSAISTLEGADPKSLLAKLDRDRDRVSRGLHDYLAGLAELTEEEPDVAAAAAALLSNWFPGGLALTRLRYAGQTEATHGILKGATEEDLQKEHMATTGCARFVVPLGRIQAKFDAAAAAKPADAQKLADLRDAVDQAEERWDAGYLSLVVGIKDKWRRGTPERERELDVIADPVRQAVARTRAARTRKRGSKDPGPTTPDTPAEDEDK